LDFKKEMRKMNNIYIRYSLGLYLLALGIVFLALSGFGVSSWDSFTNTLALNTGVLPGIWVFIIGIGQVLGIALITRKKPNYSAIIIGLVISLLINLNFMILPPVIGEYTIISGIMGIVFMGSGIALYTKLGLPMTPFDNFMIGMLDLVPNITIAKLITDGIGLGLGILVGSLTNGMFGLGTIIIFITLAPLIGFFDKLFNKNIDKIKR
jgi:uncharacterized membrane protein YczE